MPARRRLESVASALVVAALAVGAAACSSSSAAAGKGGTGTTSTTERVAGTGVVSATSGDSPDPCTIVTAAEVQAITGTAATPSGPKDENRGRTCSWHPGDGTSPLVQVFKGKQFYDPALQAPTATKLSGIGDDAYLDDFAPTRAAVGFVKGDTAVFIDGLQVTSANAVVAAARGAASRI